MVICEDFNVTLDPELDNQNYATERCRRSRTTMHEIIDRQGLVDIYRAMHGTKKAYTWFSDSGPQRA